MLRVVNAALNKCTVQSVNSTLFFFSLKFLAPCLLRELSSLVHMHQHLWCLLLVVYIWSVQIFSKLTLFGVILFKDLSCDKWHKIAYSGMTMLLILPGTFFPESRFPNTLNSLILYYTLLQTQEWYGASGYEKCWSCRRTEQTLWHLAGRIHQIFRFQLLVSKAANWRSRNI